MTFSSCCNQPWKIFLIWLTNHGHECQGLTCFCWRVWMDLLVQTSWFSSNAICTTETFKSRVPHQELHYIWEPFKPETRRLVRCLGWQHTDEPMLPPFHPDFWPGSTRNFTTAAWNRSFWNIGNFPIVAILTGGSLRPTNPALKKRIACTNWRAIWVKRFGPATARLFKFRKTCLTIAWPDCF